METLSTEWLSLAIEALAAGSAWETRPLDVQEGDHLDGALADYATAVARARSAELSDASVLLFVPVNPPPASPDVAFPSLRELQPWAGVHVPRLYLIRDAWLSRWVDREEVWTSLLPSPRAMPESEVRGLTSGLRITDGTIVEWSRDVVIRTAVGSHARPFDTV